MRISEHSVDNYIERVWGFPHHMAGKNAREVAKRQIRKAIFNPDHIYRVKKDRCPIYMGEGVAVPFENMTATSAYNEDTFKKKIDGC